MGLAAAAASPAAARQRAASLSRVCWIHTASISHPRTADIVRAGRLFRPTLPATRGGTQDAVSQSIPSVELLLRGGFVRQSSAGVFSLLTPGLRVLRKVSDIVRNEMTAPSGLAASEMAMPTLLPSSLWRTSGRWDTMQAELLTLKARGGTEYLLGPTHEEEVTKLVSQDVQSYRQLPVRVFQITSKFRNELRPRAGLLRTREFVMKDLYSFDQDPEAARESYQSVRDAYARIFNKLLGERHGKWVAAMADTGAIGGELSHEYHLPDPLGEDNLMSCSTCHGIWNQELAPTAVHKHHSASLPISAEDVKVELFAAPSAFATTASEALPGLPEDQTQSRRPAAPSVLHAFVVPKNRTMNSAAVARAVVGVTLEPVSLGHPVIGPGDMGSFFNQLSLHIDSECTAMDPMEMMEAVSIAVISATDAAAAMSIEQNGLDGPPPSLYELFPTTTIPTEGGLEQQINIDTSYGTFRQAEEGDACGVCAEKGVSSPLQSTKAIEVAHAFLLGTRYSDVLGAGFVPAPNSPAAMIASEKDAADQALESTSGDSSLQRRTGHAPFQMGCFGVGISRLIGALAQRAASRGGDKTLVWPRSVAPYPAYVIAPSLEKASAEDQAAVERVIRLLTSSSPEAQKARSQVQAALTAQVDKVGASEASFIDSPLTLDDIILDDRATTVPKRLVDAELLGSPLVVVLGRSWAQNQEIEVIIRDALPSDDSSKGPYEPLQASKRVTALVKLDEGVLNFEEP